MKSTLCQTMILGTLFSAALQAAQVTVVDDAGTARNGRVGYWSSIVARGGDVAISYYCETDPPDYYSLRFAWWSGTAWEWTTLESYAGSDTSMARGSDGLYQIAYSSWLGLGYSVGGGLYWNIDSVPVDPALAPVNISLVLDAANHPHIAYMNLANGGDHSLRYIYHNGTQWVTPTAGGVVRLNQWTPTIGFSNTYLALDGGGVPHMALAIPTDATNAYGEIQYATLQGATWQFESLGVSGVDPSVAIGQDGVPRMLFNSDTGLTYAYKSGGTWHFEALLANEWANSFALHLSAADVPFATFGLGANEDMYLAERSAGGWTITKIDGDGSPSPDQLLGRYGVGLDVDESGRPHVSYGDIQIYDMTHRANLKYYGETTPSCVSINGAPLPQLGCPGDNVTFSVVANGTGTLNYQWRRNATPLSDGPTGTGSEILGAHDASLLVSNISASDVGSYDCIVTAGCGSAGSSAATLTLGTPLTISVQPTPVTLCPPATAHFSVTAVSPANPSYQWRKNGLPLNDGKTPGGSIVAGAKTTDLVISGTSAADAGNYDCVVTAGCSQSACSPAALTIFCGGGGCDGDLNEDGVIDLGDLAMLLAHYGDDGAGYGDGDLNGDTVVDLADLALLLSRYGSVCP